MSLFNHFKRIITGLFFVVAGLSQGCQNGVSKNSKPDSLAIRKSIAETPVVNPNDAINKMQVADGFQVKLVAAEPLITAPVALNFDEKGRIWVVEMQDYMPDTVGTGEDIPGGKVVILTDTNGDGVMDSSKVFLDSLVLPRAICLIDKGILVAAPPYLWYYDINNDKPVNKTLVDSEYATGGNVEHRPNGLFRGMDNWIYNAKSAKRYRKIGNKWVIERTHFRGQWGITQDDEGRLYYNTNSDNLLGDYFMPGLGAWNEDQKSVAGFVKTIVPDLRVYPIRPTPGVNRGYQPGILDDSLRLVNFTAACGTLVYNGALFGDEYYGNAFVAEPSANLIKRDILTDDGYVTTGKEAYTGKEFLASKDERFRPVNLFNGPDGALYIVDMYRGIIQHKTYLTPYLKNEIKERSLSKPLNCGRIYKVVPANKSAVNVQFGNTPQQLVPLLQNPNGWVRRRAQQLLTDAKDKSVVPALQALLKNTGQPVPLTHALWTLEGLQALQPADIMPLLQQGNWVVRVQGLAVLPSILNKANYHQFMPVLKNMIDNNDTLAAPYIAFLAHFIQPLDAPASHQILMALAGKYPNNIYVADAIISNLYKKEDAFYKEELGVNPDTSLVINQRFKKVLDDIAKAKNSSNLKALAKLYPKGAAIFQSVCQACHGMDGNGISAVAPPLNGSNWVQGDKNKVISIVLYGLSGPVKVSGKTYTINGEMPGIGANKDYSDEDIAQILSFIRNAWNNKADKIKAADIANIRAKYGNRQKAFNMDELTQTK
ncbi:MAG TPA: c-type cytochrome [Chitinophagaceae bacterium]|nr:c-type cytochrome [Chitinophagaceae bacterium]